MEEQGDLAKICGATYNCVDHRDNVTEETANVEALQRIHGSEYVEQGKDLLCRVGT